MGIFNKDSFKSSKPQDKTIPSTPSPKTNEKSPNWFMYHGGYNHGGYIGSGSNLNSSTVNENDFGLLRSIDLEGSILSVPAVVDGYIYVGVSNSHNEAVKGYSGGGTVYKVDITSGKIAAQFSWHLQPGEGDTHGFYGMGCTPTVINNKVYFSAFNGHVYCLDQKDLSCLWETDLRKKDVSKNQPVSNTSEDIVANIFASPTLLKNYGAYISGLSAQAWQPISGIMLKMNYEVDIAKQIQALGANLEAAEKNNNKPDINKYTTLLAEEMGKLIAMDSSKFEVILQEAIPFLQLPVAAGWCSPLVVNFNTSSQQSSKLYVGVSEGENPLLFGFIYALDAETGKVDWIYCTAKNEVDADNPPNQLPAPAVNDEGISGYSYTPVDGFPQSLGCSVWSAITYDEDTGLIYASTGNPQPDGTLEPDPKDYSNGILALKADTGDFVAFRQMPVETQYRPTDVDVDIGSACTIFELNGRKVVSVSCKNGGFMVCDATTLELINHTSLLPRKNDGSQFEAIDPHPPVNQQNVLSPHISNEVSNTNDGENYFGPFNTAAIHPPSKSLFIGIGGPNYHLAGPGIDHNTTPFMRAINMETLQDCWPVDTGEPPRYTKTGASMYTTAGESGLSSPAVVNDVVFCSTSKISIYAFRVDDGTLLWSRNIGSQTEGFNGGYGYCLGPAIWQDYVVAGGLILGQSGGILEIYGPKNTSSSTQKYD